MELFSKITDWVKQLKIYSDNVGTDINYEEYKILVLGDKSVGKTSICNRFCQNEFSLEVKPSTAYECYLKIVKLIDDYIKLYIIDTTENILTTNRKEIYADVKGALIVYDLTKTSTFENIDKWILDIKQGINSNLPIMLIGHKSDLIYLRNIDIEEGEDKAKKCDIGFMETSCLDEFSIDNAVKMLVAKIYYNDMPENKKNYLKMSLIKQLEKQDATISDDNNNNNNNNNINNVNDNNSSNNTNNINNIDNESKAENNIQNN